MVVKMFNHKTGESINVEVTKKDLNWMMREEKRQERYRNKVRETGLDLPSDPEKLQKMMDEVDPSYWPCTSESPSNLTIKKS